MINQGHQMIVMINLSQLYKYVYQDPGYFEIGAIH